MCKTGPPSPVYMDDQSQQANNQLSAVTPSVAGLRAKAPPLWQRYSEDEVKESIQKHFGILTSVCCELDCTWGQIQSAIKRWKLETFVQSMKHQFVSAAEQALLQALEDPRNSLDAAKFILSTQGKEAGWSRDPNIAVAVQVTPEEQKTQIKAIFGISNGSVQDDPGASGDKQDGNQQPDQP